MLIRLFRLKLKSKPVLNQGCVLDGFPKTYEQAKALYEEVDEDGEALANPDPQVIFRVKKIRVKNFFRVKNFLGLKHF